MTSEQLGEEGTSQGHHWGQGPKGVEEGHPRGKRASLMAPQAWLQGGNACPAKTPALLCSPLAQTNGAHEAETWAPGGEAGERGMGVPGLPHSGQGNTHLAAAVGSPGWGWR